MIAPVAVDLVVDLCSWIRNTMHPRAALGKSGFDDCEHGIKDEDSLGTFNIGNDEGKMAYSLHFQSSNLVHISPQRRLLPISALLQLSR
jgi:hypothetical protein